MKKYDGYGNYCLKPVMKVFDKASVSHGADAVKRVVSSLGNGRVLVLDAYPGVDVGKLVSLFSPYFKDDAMFDFGSCRYDGECCDDIFRDNLSDDRVFGFMSHKNMEDVFDPVRISALRDRIASAPGRVLVYGPGAALLGRHDLLVYADINRWEIQLRYRDGMPNWLWDNPEAPVLEKYKRGFFIEWRIADRHKDRVLDSMDFIIDANSDDFKMISSADFHAALKALSGRPFRMEPYFDPGVWGGRWMMDKFGLPEKENYAWSFDGVPEENSINLGFGEDFVSFPAMDLVLKQPDNLLGARVKARFGREFPIRFDLLDTMDGQNLSLQVHPLTEYIQNAFGMNYTQDESYYILDAGEDACVYIGLKDGVDKEAMMRDLELAQEGKIVFDAGKYVNRIPVKKHDHVLIPAGTVHCSGRNSMVLEISSTPYIFTFKLWDWGRLGLDGLPRPIHLDHGGRNIQWDRTTRFVLDQLIHRERTVREDAGVVEEQTGLHELEFIETRRYSITSECTVEMTGSVEQLNLVDGENAFICPVDDGFEPFEVHYGESFIIPASVGRYVIKRGNTPVKVVRAYVR